MLQNAGLQSLKKFLFPQYYSMFSTLQVCYENVLYKFTFDIDIDVDIADGADVLDKGKVTVERYSENFNMVGQRD